MIQPEPITVDGRDGVVVFLDADGQPVDPQSPAAVLARAVFDDGGRATYTVEPKKINLGGEGSGNFGHAGRPGEVGGSGPGGAREFKGDEGFDWHEAPAMEDYVKTLPYEDVEAVAGYAGFGYDDINRHLRGSFEPRIINEFVREATPEEIARFGKGGPDPERPWLSISAEKRGGYPPRDASDYLPDDPVNKVDDGRIVHNVFTEDPKTGAKVEWSIQRAVPDLKYVAKLESQTAKIDESIRSRGYELPEAIKVNRAAYIPGLSFDELKSMEGEVIEEKGFTSTMVGNPNKRLDAYVVGGKTESLSKRYPDESWDARMTHQDEVGAAMRIEIVLPKGTKVAPVEAIRRIDHEFPKIQDPAVFDHPEWLDVGTHGEKLKPEDFTIRNYAAKPTVKTNRLHDKGQRSEAEILLGSGAQFRIDHVQHGERSIVTRDLHPIDVVDVRLTYIGGGSSEGPESPALHATLEHPESKPKKLSYREKLAALMLGGEGSGNFGHVGRPGEVGGSGSGGGQARAKAGGEYGPNDDWYPGGAFIATTDMPKRERAKIDRMAANDMEMVDIGGPRQKIAPGQIPIVRDVGTAVNRDFSINETYLDRAGYDDEHKTQIRAAAARAVKGERLFDIKEFPALARVDDVVRLIAADKPVPGAALDRALKYRPDLGKYLVRAKPLSLGGAGSGNFGHAGRPGEVGGSASGDRAELGAHDYPMSERDRKKSEKFKQQMEEMAARYREDKAREEAIATRGPVDYPHGKATHAEVTARLRALVPKVSVDASSQVATTAASHAEEVLKTMAAQGYRMPDSVTVHFTQREGVAAQIAFARGGRALSIKLPKTLPPNANLDDAVAVGFGGRDGDHDRFATRTMNDVIVHEMGHVQAGLRAGHSGMSELAKQAFPTKKAMKAAMLQVSKYAAKNEDEFLAESFVKLYRGETLPREAQALYNGLNGPEVRR